MTFHPLQQRPVHVAGIGLHRYQSPSDTTFVDLGLTAVRAALADAGDLPWPEVEAAFVGSAILGMAPGRIILSRLGATGLAIQQCENASASGSTAVAPGGLRWRRAARRGAGGRASTRRWHADGARPRRHRSPGGRHGRAVHPLRPAGQPLHDRAPRADDQVARVALKNHATAPATPSPSARRSARWTRSWRHRSRAR